MAKKNTRVKRVPPNLVGDIDEILKTRVRKGLMPLEKARFTKGMELLTKTQGYRMSLEELKFKPERKKNGKK